MPENLRACALDPRLPPGQRDVLQTAQQAGMDARSGGDDPNRLSKVGAVAANEFAADGCDQSARCLYQSHTRAGSPLGARLERKHAVIQTSSDTREFVG